MTVTPHILVVGGAGYIGSQMVKHLLNNGCRVTTFDNLSTGHRNAVLGGTLVVEDLANAGALDALFRNDHFDAVMHFASFIQVGESVVDPAKYYANNVANTLNLLNAMVAHGVQRFIFSSTAAVYGEPQYNPIDESHPKEPISPYGRSKWMVEQFLQDYARAYGLRFIALRYFNAAGADPDGQLGERHDPETHLIPLVLQAASNRRPHISVFGRDYETPDGTCIRDYIHVVDLCEAHWLALGALLAGSPSAVYNLGNGQGFSVQQVINAAREVTGRDITVVDAPRREGDPARLVSDATQALRALGWQPTRFDLNTIIEDAWRWESKTCRAIQKELHPT
ncbi:MAG: UDP-glucose 4-epimerase GalE [Thiobacillaceae bacterium]